jgi:hypothetical protein
MRRGPGADGRLNTGAVDPSRGAGAFQPQRDHRKPHVAGLTAQTRAGRAAARSQPATRPRCRRRAASMSAEPCRGGYGARPGSRMGAEANACARRFVDSRAELGSDRLPDPAGRRRESSPFPLAKVLRLTLRAPNRAPTSRQPLPAAHRACLRKRPLPSSLVVRLDGGRVLGPPPPNVLSAARSAPAMSATQRFRVRPELI